MTAVFMSDVHLIDGDSMKSKLVIRFLEEVASSYDELYILGDFFDIWPGTTTHLVDTYARVLSALRQLVEEGTQVYFVEGNHDFRLGDYFEKELGIKVYTDSLVRTFGTKQVYMMHGDTGNPKDLGYRALRFLLRRETVHKAKKIFPEAWAYKIGFHASRLSRKAARRTPELLENVRHTFRSTACKIMEQGYDLVLMGHTHIPDDHRVEINGRQCRYINLGDWVQNFTYLEFKEGEFYTKKHPIGEYT